MGEYKKGFDIEFLERTLTIIEDLEKNQFTKYNITLLLNCALALLCLPTQRNSRNSTFCKNCVDYLKTIKIDLPININPDLTNRRTIEQQIIHYIRNAFAHLHIETNKYASDENIKSVTIWNESSGTNNFELTFSTLQLSKFCKFVANQYLENLKEAS